jgi:hypothetical protein
VTGYDDGSIACTDSEIVIRNYYFPAGAKRIPYAAIKEVREVPLRVFGKWRIWGSGDFVHWFNLDVGRPRKETALVVHTNARIRPVITPDDPARVVAELTGQSVNVTTTREHGAV